MSFSLAFQNQQWCNVELIWLHFYTLELLHIWMSCHFLYTISCTTYCIIPDILIKASPGIRARLLCLDLARKTSCFCFPFPQPDWPEIFSRWSIKGVWAWVQKSSSFFIDILFYTFILRLLHHSVSRNVCLQQNIFYVIIEMNNIMEDLWRISFSWHMWYVAGCLRKTD